MNIDLGHILVFHYLKENHTIAIKEVQKCVNQATRQL